MSLCTAHDLEEGVITVGKMMRRVATAPWQAPQKVESGVPRFFDREMVELTATGVDVKFYHLSERTVVCVIRERDGWETVATCQTTEPDRFNPLDAKYRALHNAMKKRNERPVLREVYTVE